MEGFLLIKISREDSFPKVRHLVVIWYLELVKMVLRGVTKNLEGFIDIDGNPSVVRQV